MGKYTQTIKRMIKGLEIKSGEILLLNREEFFSERWNKKVKVLVLKNSKNKKHKILSSASEPIFIQRLAELFKLDKKELIDILHPKQKEDKDGDKR